MMTIAEAFGDFLSRDDARVAILKGDWGVGKTYSMKEFVAQREPSNNLQNWSYSSLFGKSSLESLKLDIVSNINYGPELPLKKSLSKIAKFTSALKEINIPYINAGNLTADLLNSVLLQDLLILIDDIERKESTISPSALLGFISELKEQRRCKIVLIYNEAKLDPIDRKAINEYREKIVDFELAFQPTVQQNLKIVWPEGAPELVNEAFETCNLANIRVMQKARWIYEFFDQELTHNIRAARNAVLRKCVVMSVIHHAFPNIIALEKLVDTSLYEIYLNEDATSKEGRALCKKLSFSPESFDSIIAQFIISGQIERDEAQHILDSCEKEYEKNAMVQRHWDSWEAFHNRFSVTQDEFISDQRRIMESGWPLLRLQDIESSVRFLKELDDGIDLEDILDLAVEKFIRDASEKDWDRLTSLPTFSRELVSLVRNRASATQDPRSIDELMHALAGNNGWNPKDLVPLSRFETGDFVKWLTSPQSGDTISRVENFFNRFAREGEIATAIGNNLRAALDELSGRSRLDGARVTKILGKRPNRDSAEAQAPPVSFRDRDPARPALKNGGDEVDSLKPDE